MASRRKAIYFCEMKKVQNSKTVTEYTGGHLEEVGIYNCQNDFEYNKQNKYAGPYKMPIIIFLFISKNIQLPILKQIQLCLYFME